MTFIIEVNEGTAGRRRVPVRIFLSNGTAPDTGASNDSIMLSSNGGSQFTSAGPLSAVSAAAGMYYTELSASNVSVLGSLAGWHWQGDFPQHVFNAQIVNNNPMSSLSAVDYSTITMLGVNFISTAGMRSIASSIASTNFGNGRIWQEALFALRNRVQISGSTGTVFLTDDTTSSWTFSVTTGTSPLNGIDPGGA